MDKRPIGVFDSGLGGLTAVSEIMRILPSEDIIYLGDTGRVPYGTRSKETIIRYTRECIAFLKSYNIKAIITACGTVSSVALPTLENDYDIPIIGVVRPASVRAAAATRNKKIGIIGTSATVKSRAYEHIINEKLPDAETFSAVCPLFVPLVENGRTDSDDRVLLEIAEGYLAPLREVGVDTLVMGCTHYPIIEKTIAKVMGSGVTLINPGLEAAQYLHGCAAVEKSDTSRGKCSFFVSDDAEGFAEHGSAFLGDVLGRVSEVDVGR